MKILSQALLAVALVAAISGGVFLLINRSRGPDMEIILPSPTAQVQVQVYITGAVQNPDVYALRDGARLKDAIEAAGGPTTEADLASVNLAALVRDQDHWHVPRIGEAVSGLQVTLANNDGRIDINTATADQLESLPKIGPVLAKAIIQYRESKGSFARVDDLLNVSGIGPGILSAIKDFVKVE